MLAATTLVAQIAAESRARVTIVSMDEAKGMLFAGTPDARLFWMDEQGQFATRGEAPDWLPSYPGYEGGRKRPRRQMAGDERQPDAPPLRVLTYSETIPPSSWRSTRPPPSARQRSSISPPN